MSIDTEEPVAEIIALKRFDTHRIWRVVLWGASATLAAAIVAGTALSDNGTERLKLALAAMTEPVKSDTSRPTASTQQLAELEQRTQQLAQTVRELTADRDRLKGRVVLLEQGFEDITGAIKKQAAQKPADLPKEVAKIAPPPPAVSPPATVVASISPPVESSAPSPAPAPAPIAAAATPMPVPLPPTRIATAEAAPEPSAPPTKEIGVDLGGAATLEGLRAHWSTLKANLGPDLIGLKAGMVVRRTPAGATDYRLVVGPLPSSSAAIRLCSKMATTKTFCRAGLFNVQQFAER